MAAKSKPKAFPLRAVVVGACVLGGAVLAGVAAALGAAPGGGVVGSVNGQDIYADELAMYAVRHRAAVAAAFSTAHGLAGTGADFWTTEYDGEHPVDALLQAAMTELTRDHVVAAACNAYGITAPANFLQLQSALDAENDDRTQTLNTGGYVFGTEQYSLDQYSDYQLTQATDELKTVLLQGDWAPTEAQLDAAFATLDESLTRKDFTAAGWAFLWPQSAEEENAQNLAAAQIAIEQALADGADPQNLPTLLKGTLPELRVQPIELDSLQRSKDDVWSDILTDVLFDVEVGQSCTSTATGENAVYYLTEKSGGGRYTRDQAPRLAESAYINAAFDAWLAEQTAAATQTLNTAKARKAVLAAVQG